MPIINGVGQSDITRIKQKHFREILRVHLQITGHIFKKNADKDWWNKRYYYFDLNAGRGHDCDGNIGSPLIFSEEAARAGIDAMAVFIEKEPENADVLRQCVSGVICGDHTEKLPELFPDNDKVWRYGLLYSDPNGVFDTECIRRFSEQPCFHATDILINCNSTTIKRVRQSPKHTESRSLAEKMEEIKKKYWIIREPYGKQQWSFILGTNWLDFPEFKKIGFYKLNSKKGAEIFNKINLTNDENKQLTIEGSGQLTYENYQEYLKHPEFLKVKKKPGIAQMDFVSGADHRTQRILTI